MTTTVAAIVIILVYGVMAEQLGWYAARKVYRPKPDPNGYGWTCRCGTSSHGFPTMDAAMADLDHHDAARHPHYDPEGDLLGQLFGGQRAPSSDRP